MSSEALIRWGYYQAARLTSWTVTGGVLTGHTDSVDSYRIAQAPLVFVVGHVTRQLSNLTMTGGVVTARVGAPEASHGDQ